MGEKHNIIRNHAGPIFNWKIISYYIIITEYDAAIVRKLLN